MIKEGDFVLFNRGEYIRVLQVVKDKEIMIDRMKCKLDNLIGKPFGFDYELKDRQFRMIEGSTSAKLSRADINRDNRNLLDRSGNQKMTTEDIERLKKEEDLSAHDIIDKLIENSASFSGKTEYSQEKYIKKKKDKYLTVYKILKPTVRNLCKFYTQAAMKRKLLNMRIDTIAQILTYGNLAAHKNVIVVESCKGLILASVVERLSGFGQVVNLSPNGSHISTMESLNYMNFPAEYTKNVYNYPLEKIDKIQDYINDLTHKLSIPDNKNVSFEHTSSTNNPLKVNFIGFAKVERQTIRLEVAKKVNALFENQEIDCLVIATKFRPLPILKRLINSMKKSCHFVIYSQIQEPLIECHTFLKSNQKAVHIELTDNWMREYQVLTDRTHPKNMMDCCSGFLLTGITVLED